MPKCRVDRPRLHLGRRPAGRGCRGRRACIYEAHVRGLTKRHPELPVRLRGTYAGLGAPPVIDYLVKLGITAIELLPVHAFVDDRRLVERGPAQLLGLQLDRATSRPSRATPPRRARSSSSRRWSSGSTRPASR